MKNIVDRLAYYWKFVAALVAAIAVTILPVVEAAVDDGQIDKGEVLMIVVTAATAFGGAGAVYKVRNRPLPGALSYEEDALFRGIKSNYRYTYDHQE